MEKSKVRFELEKYIWTIEDFENMGWHDSQIHSFCFENTNHEWSGNLIFDIDYIFKWIHPKRETDYFSFWIAPCTLIFSNVFDLKINIQTKVFSLEPLEIDEISFKKSKNLKTNEVIKKWKISLQLGSLSFRSESFTQIVRNKPIITDTQQLSFEQRGGISFSQIPIKV